MLNNSAGKPTSHLSIKFAQCQPPNHYTVKFPIPKSKPTPPPFLPIENRDGELEYGREGYPEEIGNLCESDPPYMWEDGNHRPEKRPEDEEDIDGGENIALESKLQRSKGEVKDEIERKRERHHPRDFPRKCPVKHRAK